MKLSTALFFFSRVDKDILVLWPVNPSCNANDSVLKVELLPLSRRAYVMTDLLPRLTVTFNGIIAILVLRRAQDGLSSSAAALAMEDQFRHLYEYQRRMWTPFEGGYAGWMHAFLCTWRPYKLSFGDNCEKCADMKLILMLKTVSSQSISSNTDTELLHLYVK